MDMHLGWRRDMAPAQSVVKLALGDVGPFMTHLHHAFGSGIGMNQVHEIAGHAEALELGDEWQHTYTLNFQQHATDLRLRVISDEPDVLLLEFQGPPPLIAQIDRLIEQYEGETQL